MGLEIMCDCGHEMEFVRTDWGGYLSFLWREMPVGVDDDGNFLFGQTPARAYCSTCGFDVEQARWEAAGVAEGRGRA